MKKTTETMDSLPRDVKQIIAAMARELALAAVSRVWFALCPFVQKRQLVRAKLYVNFICKKMVKEQSEIKDRQSGSPS